jgi:gliding motility-associated-like protein
MEFIEKKYHLTQPERRIVPVNPEPMAACTNVGFEAGSFAGWTGNIGSNQNSLAAMTIKTAGFISLAMNSPEASCSGQTLMSTAGAVDTYGGFPVVSPTGGTFSCRLGGEFFNLDGGPYGYPCAHGVGGSSGAESIQQTFTVSTANAMFTYQYAVVLDAANHAPADVPYFRAEVLDQNNKVIPCLQYYVASDSVGPPVGFSISPTKTQSGSGDPSQFGTPLPVFYCPWVSTSLNLTAFIGQNVTVRFTAAGCTQGGHWGYAYVDASCGPVQILASTPEVCLGGTITLTAPPVGPGGGTYSWTGPGITTNPTLPSVTLNQPGNYEVTVTQGVGCTYKIDTVIAFYPNPSVTATSTNASCSPGNDGTATATVTGVAPGSFTTTWTPAPGAGQGTLNVTKLSAGTYTVTVSTTAGACTASTTVTITQPPGAPTVTLTNTPATCSPGADGTATATVTPAGAYTFTWSPAVTGQGTLNATGLNGGVYTFTATPAAGCAGTATTTVTQPNGPTATFTSTNVSCFGLSDGTATVTGTGGSAPLTFVWTGGGTTGLPSTPAVTGLSAATYTCTVGDSKGCSIPVIITITEPTVLAVTASGVAATCAGKCNGQVICIPTGGTTTYTYAWTGSAAACVGPSCNLVCAGTYTSNITDAHGCKATATATVTEPTPIVLTMFPTASHCNKPDGADSVFASGGTPGYTYSWSPGAGSTSPGYHNIPAASYTVNVTDNHGCPATMNNVVPNLPGVNITQVSSTPVSCFGGSDGTAKDSASSGFPPYTFAWTPVGGTAATATGLPVGTYTCTVTDSKGCTNSVPVPITQPPLLVLTIGPPATICIGQCFDLTATAVGGTTAYTFAWIQNGTAIPSTHVCPIVTTTYTVSVIDAHGCFTAPQTVTITVKPPLEVVANTGGTICPGASFTLGAVASGGNGAGTYTYSWIPPTGLDNPNISNPVATPAVTTIYTVIVSDNCGNVTDSAFETVTVWPPPVVTFTTVDTVRCAPMCAHFTGTSTPACFTGSWTFGDGTSGTACDLITHCYTNAGTYNVSYFVTDVNGCKGSATTPNFINALPVPIAAFTDAPQPTTLVQPKITFTDGSTNAVSWLWHFGDPYDSSSVLQNPVFTYLDTGCYTVTLMVTSANGCTATTKGPVCIQPEFDFYAPNAFTPNGDGVNDVWCPKGVGIELNDYDMMIFDRWGNLLYETHTWGQGWDGKANGGSNIAQIDTYVWKVKLLDVFGYKHQYIGRCSIIK